MIDGSHIVAVMSRNAEKAKSYAQRHNVPRWYSDAQALVDDEEVTDLSGTVVSGQQSYYFVFQSGDVITQLGEDEITGYTDLIEALGRAEPDQEITVLLVRSGPEEQAQMELTVTVKQAME